MASLILGTVGTAIGGPVGGFIGSTIGSYIDAWLFAPDPPDTEGPRISDTSQVAADPGMPMSKTYGTNRVAGIVLHTSDLIETKNVDKQRSGKQSYTNTTYTYSLTCSFLVNDGVILGIGRIWVDGKLFRAFRDDFVSDVTTYRYNVGGFPYPSWYRTAGRMYDPAQLTWHQDPTLAGATADRWHVNTSDGSLIAGAGTGSQLTYYQDPTSGYYIPLGTQTAYQGGVKTLDDGSRRTWTDYYNLYAALNDWSPKGIFTVQNPNDIAFYRGTSDQPSDPTMSALAGETVPAYRNRAYLVFDNLQLEDFGNRLPNFTFEVVRFENETPTTIITDIMQLAGVTQYAFDGLPSGTDLRNFVPGYTLNRKTTFRKAIEAVMDAFNIDVAEINTQLVFRDRVRNAEHVIQYAELAAHNADDRETAEQLTLNRKDRITLPRIIEAAYTDIERDYQPNTSRYFLKQTENTHLASVDLGITLYPQYAKSWVQRKLQDLWNEQKTIEFNLPPKYIYVSPSDIIVITTETEIGNVGGTPIVASFTAKVTEVRRGVNGILTVKAIVKFGALYPADDYDNFSNENNYVSFTNFKNLGLTEFAFLDIPPLSVSDVAMGVYVAFCDLNNTEWSGADLLQSTDGGNNYSNVTTGQTAAAIGEITSGSIALGTPNTVENHTFVVTLDSATATIPSSTVTQMLNLTQLAYVGGEIISISTVSGLGNRQFQISGPIIRGLKDTSASAHTSGAEFVLLNTAVIDWGASLSTRNLTIDYKPVTIGLTEAITPNEQYTHTAARLTPFKPVNVTGARDGSNNLTITWVRQDKLFTEWMDFTELGLSETQLEFDVEIYDGITLVRTITVSAETASYTAAEQTADGLTPGDPVSIRVYQISTVVGRGNAAIETV